MNPTRLERITDETEFYESFFQLSCPVVVIGAARKMTAFTRWTDRYLRSVLAGLRPTVRFSDGRMGTIPIETFLDYLTEPDRFHSSRGAMYLTDFYVQPSFDDPRREALAVDAAFPLRRGGPYAEWISLYAGPVGTSTAFHQDIFSTHTWLAQLRGEKLWRLCPPGTDLTDPETFNNSQFYQVLLEPGDLIYLPPDWWHEVRNTTSTLAVSGNFCSFVCAEKALAEAKNSRSPHRDVWIRTWVEILAQQAGRRK
jgi:hypothetical protein